MKYVKKEYPKFLYHKSEKAKIVKDEDEQIELGKEWVSSPALLEVKEEIKEKEKTQDEELEIKKLEVELVEKEKLEVERLLKEEKESNIVVANMDMKKDELIAMAEKLEIKIDKSLTKEQIITLIYSKEVKEESEVKPLF